MPVADGDEPPVELSVSPAPVGSEPDVGVTSDEVVAAVSEPVDSASSVTTSVVDVVSMVVKPDVVVSTLVAYTVVVVSVCTVVSPDVVAVQDECEVVAHASSQSPVVVMVRIDESRLTTSRRATIAASAPGVMTAAADRASLVVSVVACERPR